MQMKKRILSAFMALCMVCSLVGVSWAVTPQQSSAAENGSFNITYNSHQTTAYLIDESGNPINIDSNGTTMQISPSSVADLAPDIDGYTYSRATVASSRNAAITSTTNVTRLQWSSGRNAKWQYNANNNWQNFGNSSYLYFIYTPNTPTAPTSTTVTTGKSAVLQDDGTYNLSLSVSGDRGSDSQKQKLDVLFILDMSNSMGDQWNGQKRITAARSAISQIIGIGDNNGLSDNTNLDVQYALVGFGGGDSEDRWSTYQDAETREDWTSDGSAVINEIPDIVHGNSSRSSSNYYGGGTNYEAGFREGNTVLGSARNDAQTVVIFISDGGPGYYYSSGGYGQTAGITQGDGSPDNYNGTALEHGATEVAKLSMDYFYFVGVTDTVTSKVFTTIVDAANVSDKNHKDSISAATPDELLKAFEDIQAQITFYAANNVKMSDPLSLNAELVPNAENEYDVTLTLQKRNGTGGAYQNVATQTISVSLNKSAVVTLTDNSGETVESVPMTVIINKEDNSQPVINVTFDPNYQLAKNYRYVVTTKITPSDAAIEAGTEGYDGTGQLNTGTYAGQRGFWSNDNENAKVTFNAIVTDENGNVTSSTPGEEAFPKPVIQVPPEKDREIGYTKYVTDNHDNTYDLTLTVSGAVSTSTQGSTPLDIIFVLDESGSMQRGMSNDNNAQSGSQRIDYAKDAIETMVESLAGNQAINQRFALVTFHTTATTETFSSSEQNSSWTTNADAFNQVVSSQTYVPGHTGQTQGGTNYEAALNQVKNLMSSVRENTPVVVVFVSDGDPTYYNNSNGSLGGNGSDYDETALAHAQICLSELTDVDRFYTVGVGPEDSYTHLNDLTNEEDFPFVDGYYGERYQLPEGMITQNYVGDSPNNLTNAFNDISSQITTFLCTNVNISDTLSENVTPVFNTDGTTPKKLLVSIVDEDGISKVTPATSVTAPATKYNPETSNRTITAVYSNGQVQLQFPSTYQLEPGWTYSVTIAIEATETAYQNYRNNGNSYPNIGEAETGETSAGQQGVHTNTTATLTYNYKGTPEQENYNKPVIQLHPKTLTITKTVSGIEPDNTYKDGLSFVVNIGSGDTVINETIQLSDSGFKQNEDGTYTYTYVYEGLSPEAAYSVTESGGTVTGYELTSTPESKTYTGKLPAWNSAENANADFTNTYARQDTILTINKYVNGTMGDTSVNTSFGFTIKLTDTFNNDAAYTLDNNAIESLGFEAVQNEGSIVEGTYTFTLSHGQQKVIHLPYGVQAEITETDSSYDEFYRSYSTLAEDAEVTEPYSSGRSATVTMQGDMTVDFQNTLNVDTPTGLFDNNTPYTLMFTAAGLAGAALIITIVMRRQRRRRE